MDPVTLDKILKEANSKEKWYHGDRQWQKQKGSKWHSRKRKPMKTEPKE